MGLDVLGPHGFPPNIDSASGGVVEAPFSGSHQLPTKMTIQVYASTGSTVGPVSVTNFSYEKDPFNLIVVAEFNGAI